MKPLFELFFNICLLRAKPQDIPVSSALMLVMLLATIVSGVPAIIGQIGGLAPALMIGVMDVALILVLLKIFLRLAGLSSRLLQTATALFGTGVLINLLSIPIQMMLDASPDNSASQFFGALLFFVLLAWSLVIMGHILRHSFKLQLSSGVLVAMGYFMLINTLVRLFLPAG
ncbi:MAG: hypothetical protein GY814_06450 [Gammaproteobacteria bacterium]|nr:hypothetical protein [Gammaproteobacteria bacterium]